MSKTKTFLDFARHTSGRILQVIEETSGHARTFAQKICVSGRFLDLSRRNAPLWLAKVPAATGTLA
jgi:hypothetical protein